VNLNNLVRSAATTFITSFIALIPLSALASNDFSWVQSAAIAAALTAIRTVVAYLDPKNTSFGLGSDVAVEEVAVEEETVDAPVEGE
jgi:hypothetical protein